MSKVANFQQPAHSEVSNDFLKYKANAIYLLTCRDLNWHIQARNKWTLHIYCEMRKM